MSESTNMFYVVCDEQNVAECATLADAIAECERLASAEPLPGVWWVEDSEGNEVRNMGHWRGGMRVRDYRPLETAMSKSTNGRVPAVSVTFHINHGAECLINERPDHMRLTFADGTDTIVQRDDLARLADVYMWHGAKQKFIDAAAISRNPETGRSATVADKKAAVLEVIERCIVHGQWNKAREGGGGSGTLLLEALIRMYAGKKDRAALLAYLDGLTAEQKRQLERNPRVAPTIEAIRTERRLASGKADDGEDLLAQLD